MANALVQTDTYQKCDLAFEFFDDFIEEIDTTNVYTATLTDTGSATVGNGVGGVVVITPSDGTVGDNDEAYLGLRNLVFTPAANKTIVARCRLQYSEANTDDANVAFGFINSVGANAIVDNGGGLLASGTHFAIYKVDGGTAWKCESRNQTAVYTNTSTLTAGGSAYVTMEVVLSEITTSNMTVSFKVNDSYLVDATTGFPITHKVTYTSADAVTPFVGVKNGDTFDHLPASVRAAVIDGEGDHVGVGAVGENHRVLLHGPAQRAAAEVLRQQIAQRFETFRNLLLFVVDIFELRAQFDGSVVVNEAVVAVEN